MDPKKIARINELARKKKETGLTAEEAAEYDPWYIVDEDLDS